MSRAYFQNFRLDPDYHYFLYIGELKNYGLNIFLRESLGRRLGRPVDFVAVVPDILDQYDYANLMVVNPVAEERFLHSHRRYGCRVPAPVFLRAVSENPQVVALVKRLLERQDRLYVYMYESLPEMSLDDIDRVRVLGPRSDVARRLNNKIFQYESFGGTVPVPEFAVCRGAENLRACFEELRPVWSDGIFVTAAYSAAGANSAIARSWEELRGAGFQPSDHLYLISRYHPHRHDPTVLAVVANEDDVYVAGVADQRIEGGNRFTGSTYPSALSADLQETLYEMTRRVGRRLGREGYRGIFGCDYIVDEEKRVHFVEVNARKQGTTLEFCCVLEQLLPPGAPMLPELEFCAVTENRFPDTVVELPPGFNGGICWGTYNFKLARDANIRGFMPFCGDERQCFTRTAREMGSRQFVILEHIGNDFVIGAGSFLGRVVALGRDHDNVRMGLVQGRKMLEATIAGDPDDCDPRSLDPLEGRHHAATEGENLSRSTGAGPAARSDEGARIAAAAGTAIHRGANR